MFNPIEIGETSVVVKGSYFLKHNYYWMRLPVMLNALYRLKDQIQNKTLVVTFPDGEPMRYCGFDNITQEIAQELELPRDRFVIETHDREFVSDVATVIYQSDFSPGHIMSFVDQSQYDWCYDENTMRFGALYGRFTVQRLILAHHLSTQTQNENYVIMQSKPAWAEEELRGLEWIYQEQLQWLRDFHNSSDIPVYNDNGSGNERHRVFADYKNIWSKFYIDVVSSTDHYNKHYFSEKLSRPLLTRKPFLALAAPGTLELIRSLGFRTFGDWWDESYDREPCLNKRLDMVINEINRIDSLSDSEMRSLITDMQSTLIYNQAHYQEFFDRYYQGFKNDKRD